MDCVLAAVWKYVRIFCSEKNGSQLYNYEDFFFFVVLFAFVDANYKFVMVDIESYDEESGSGITKNLI